MRTALLWLLLSGVAVPALAAPSVTVFGADWCGPCHRVRDYLRANLVAFDFVDVDDDAGHAKFAALAGSKMAIPLTVAGGEQVRGSDFKALAAMLGRQGIIKTVAVSADEGGESYGGHSAAWWEQQFRELRMRVRAHAERVKQLDRVAVDHHERGEVLPRLQKQLKVVEASLAQLELDASRASLPRKYRAY
jgi:mycoredoxin